jgi:hypothetical protein
LRLAARRPTQGERRRSIHHRGRRQASTLTIDAAPKLGPVRGTIMRPFLKKMFYGINFTPFIEEARTAGEGSYSLNAPA